MTTALATEAKEQLAKEVEQKQELTKQTSAITPERAQQLFDPNNTETPQIQFLPEIEIIHDSQMFKLPNMKVTKELIGIIVETYLANAWWEIPYAERKGVNSPPDCCSYDGIRPSAGCERKQSDLCIICPLGGKDAFGSAKSGNGKACHNTRRLFILTDGYKIPLFLKLPATSMKGFGGKKGFGTNLNAEGYRYQMATGKYTLEKVDTYSVVKIELVKHITSEAVLKPIADMRNRFYDIMHEHEFNQEESDGE